MRFKKSITLLILVLASLTATYFLTLENRPLETMNITNISCSEGNSGRDILTLQGHNTGSFESVGPWRSHKLNSNTVAIQMQMSKLQSIINHFWQLEFTHQIDVTDISSVLYEGKHKIWSRNDEGCRKS